MKYALIVMLAVYLVTFGCNPKPEEENTANHDKVEHSAVTEAPAAPAQLTVTTEVVEQTTPEAGPAHQGNTDSHKAPAAPADVKVTSKSVISETPPAAEEHIAVEVKAEAAQNDQWENIAQSAAVTILALMNDDQGKQVVPAAVEEKAVAKDEVVTPSKFSKATTTLPCGKTIVLDDNAQLPPCMKHGAVAARQPAVPAEETELSEAMQKMVNATNDMVRVTRQLVIATQQMLTASKDVAVEVIDTGKEAIETSQPAVQDAVDESEIIKTAKEVVSATKEAFEATSKALSDALEAKDAQPAPESAPQQ